MADFTFRQYLKESGYSLMQYQEEVYKKCLAKSEKYYNVDVYFKDEIEKAFNDNVPTDQIADSICYWYDEFRSEMDADVNESTEEKNETDDGLTDGESYTQWKEYVFKYLDKRIETDKIKELGTYIKDFIKQEYDNGEPSWFSVAESVVNYARTNYPQAIKPRESNAFSITENKKNEAFIQDDRGLVSFINLSDVILKRAGVIDENGNTTVDNEQLLYSAATYIAAFYAAQSMPQGGMAAWGTRDLKSFMAKLDKMEPEDAVRSTRSIMVAKVPNDYKNEFIENVKNKVRKQNADDAEKRRQAYLNSEEHRHMQDPGWRGPNGTWSND